MVAPAHAGAAQGARAGARRTLIIVGSFPPPEAGNLGGGVLVSCRTLLAAGIGERFALRLVDSSQSLSDPPPLASRALAAVRRTLRFTAEVVRAPRPASALIFLSEGLSFIEKSALAAVARAGGLTVAVAPRGGGVKGELERHAVMRLAARVLVNCSDYVICQGASWVELFSRYETGRGRRRRAGDGRPSRFVTLMNWTATEEVLAIGRRRLAAAPPDGSGGSREPPARAGELRVLYFGTLMRRKGIEEMVEGLALARERVPGIRLTIAGDGVDEEALRARCRALGLGDEAVAFAGWVEGEAKLALFERADCLCLASWSEGLPNAVIEAMAAALAVVATPVGGVPDAAPDGEVAIHVPARSPEAVAEAFVRLASDPALRRALGARGHARARAEFTAEHALRVFDELL